MRFFVFCALLLSAIPLHTQTLNSPECVAYDAPRHRWMVSSSGNGKIFSYRPDLGTTTIFAVALSGPYGMLIQGGTLYFCDGGSVKGYGLVSGLQVFNLNLNATLLVGLTSDGAGHLFATDYVTKNIYRITPATNTYNLMATAAYPPTGIYYDSTNNQCVFVSYAPAAPIQAMSLSDSTITTLGPTAFGFCWGIARDTAGYWYVTSWANNSLMRFDPDFTNETLLMPGLSSPAGLGFNTTGDSLGIPNSGMANNVVFYLANPIGISMANEPTGISLFPNPSSGAIQLLLPSPVKGICTVTDASGKMVDSISFTGTQLIIERKENAAGIYHVSVTDAGGEIVATARINWVD